MSLRTAALALTLLPLSSLLVSLLLSLALTGLIRLIALWASMAAARRCMLLCIAGVSPPWGWLFHNNENPLQKTVILVVMCLILISSYACCSCTPMAQHCSPQSPAINGPQHQQHQACYAAMIRMTVVTGPCCCTSRFHTQITKRQFMDFRFIFIFDTHVTLVFL